MIKKIHLLALTGLLALSCDKKSSGPEITPVPAQEISPQKVFMMVVPNGNYDVKCIEKKECALKLKSKNGVITVFSYKGGEIAANIKTCLGGTVQTISPDEKIIITEQGDATVLSVTPLPDPKVLSDSKKIFVMPSDLTDKLIVKCNDL